MGHDNAGTIFITWLFDSGMDFFSYNFWHHDIFKVFHVIFVKWIGYKDQWEFWQIKLRKSVTEIISLGFNEKRYWQ